jgi:hypothetical protein
MDRQAAACCGDTIRVGSFSSLEGNSGQRCLFEQIDLLCSLGGLPLCLGNGQD